MTAMVSKALSSINMIRISKIWNDFYVELSNMTAWISIRVVFALDGSQIIDPNSRWSSDK